MENKYFKKYGEGRDVDKDLIFEGIDINFKTMTVNVDLDHENGVDTGTIINPTYTSINGYDVISIFKRKTYTGGDGNPLIYALKGIKGWKINTKDIIKLLKQFIKICNKIEPKYDTIIKITSSSELNNQFLYRLNKIIRCDNVIDTLFNKLEKSEVYDNCLEYKNISEDDMKKIDSGFEKMGDNFTFKDIPVDVRHYFKKVWSDTYIGDEINVADKINGKKVLILDDTIASGQTISSFAQSVIDMYEPESITIITLFSKI